MSDLFKLREVLWTANHRWRDHKNHEKGLPDGAWKEWGRSGLILSADSSDGKLMIFLINTQDQKLYHVFDFDHRLYDRLPESRTASCAIVGSEVYIIGGLVTRQQRVTDVYVCDLSKPYYKWTPGPALLSGMVYPLLFCLDGKIYALQCPVHGSGASFQMLDPRARSSSWKMLSTPPYPFCEDSNVVKGAACVGDDKIIVHAFPNSKILDYCAVYFAYDVKQDKWSILRKVKVATPYWSFSDPFQAAALGFVPYRAYVQDVSLLCVDPSDLFVFDFKSLEEGDPEENPSGFYQLVGPNLPTLFFSGSSRDMFSEWQIHHLGGTKFCFIFTSVPNIDFPLVHVCSFDLVKTNLGQENVSDLDVSDSDLDVSDSDEEYVNANGAEAEAEAEADYISQHLAFKMENINMGHEKVSDLDVADSGEDCVDGAEAEAEADSISHRVAFKMENIKQKIFKDEEIWFLSQSCQRPDISLSRLSWFEYQSLS